MEVLKPLANLPINKQWLKCIGKDDVKGVMFLCLGRRLTLEMSLITAVS